MSEILDHMLKKARAKNIPLITTMELTHNCNFKCKHCYNFDRSKFSISPFAEKYLSTDEILRTINALSAEGMLYLNLSGGEVLLHPDLEIIIAHARKLFVEVRIKTNASLLTLEKAKRILDAGCYALDVSLYGFSEESYYWLTQRHDQFKNVLFGITCAQALSFDVTVNIMVNKFNINEIQAMINYCDEQQLKFQISSEVTERYDGSLGAKDVEITNDQFKECLSGPLRKYFDHDNLDKALQCSCAKTVCGISSSGDVFPCIGAPINSGNVKTENFDVIWNFSEELNKIRSLKFENFSSCTSCSFISKCNRSSGSIYSNTREYTGCDKVTFDQAKIRMDFDLIGKE
jgi:radical SAM protein with 4Fe4S-binding SPASM domain